MLSARYTKTTTKLVFIINCVRLGSRYNSPFLVEWVRGDNNGTTEILYPTEDNILFFEKRYECDVTLYRSKQDGGLRPKLVHFKVMRMEGEKKKIFGKLEVDVSKYYGVDNPTVREFNLSSPHRINSTIAILFDYVSIDKRFQTSPLGHVSDLSVTTLSVTEALPTDPTDDWDVSEVTTEEQKIQIETFLKLQHNSIKSNVPSLSTFAKPHKSKPEFDLDATPRRHRAESTVEHYKHSQSIPPKTKTADRLSQFLNARAGEQLDSKTKPTNPEILLKRNSNRIYLTKPVSINLMKSVLSKPWQYSPVFPALKKPFVNPFPENSEQRIELEKAKTENTIEPLIQKCGEFPLAASIIFSIIDATQVLEPSPFSENGFQGFMQAFTEFFEKSEYIVKSSPMDVFIICTHVSALLHTAEDAIPARIQVFENLLTKCASEAFETIVHSELQKFNSIIASLITDPKSFEYVISSFVLAYNELSHLQSFFASEIFKGVIQSFDQAIVRGILEAPGIATFQNAIAWSSFATRAKAEVGAEFPLIKQSAAVLMMSQQICLTPSLIKELCPSLPIQLVYRLLICEGSDEFNPETNDVGIIERLYPTRVQQPVDLDFHIDIKQFVDEVDISNWNNAEFSAREVGEFPFLRQHFQIKG